MSKLDDLAAVLREMPVFAGIAPDRLKLIAYLATSVDLRPGHTLLTAGEPAEAVFVLVEGALDMSGVPLKRGALLGEISALTGGPERHTVTATGEARVARLPKDRFLDLLERMPEVKSALLTDFARRLERR